MKKLIIILFPLLSFIAQAQQSVVWQMRNDSLFIVNGQNWNHVKSGVIFAYGHLLGTQVLRTRNDSLFIVNNNVWTFTPSGTMYAFTQVQGNQVIGMEGGTSGQYLKKNSNSNYDYVWASLGTLATQNATITDYLTTATAALTYSAINHTHAYNTITGLPSLFDGNYNSLANKPTIPTNTNQLVNGNGFLVAADIAGKADLSGPQLTGAVTTTGSLGYRTGAGGTVTQATSKTTGVTLNKIAGQITMNGAALAAGAEVAFTLTNSTIAATDVVIVNVQSVGTAGAYLVSVGAVSAGSCSITVSNASAGSLSQAIVLNYVVIKGVNN